jgi:hypothetical protein
MAQARAAELESLSRSVIKLFKLSEIISIGETV